MTSTVILSWPKPSRPDFAELFRTLKAKKKKKKTAKDAWVRRRVGPELSLNPSVPRATGLRVRLKEEPGAKRGALGAALPLTKGGPDPAQCQAVLLQPVSVAVLCDPCPS